MQQFRREKRSDDEITNFLLGRIRSPESLFLLAENEEGKIVGFSLGEIDTNNHPVFESVKRGNLKFLWIEPNFRGQGLASKLRDEIFTWFKENGCRYIRTSVLNRNPAKKFYEKWGFSESLTVMIKEIS